MTKFTSLFLAVALAACGGSKPSTSTTTSDQSATDGHATAFKIGALDAWSIEDGSIEGPNDGKTLGVGVAPEEINKVLAAAGLPTDKIQLGIQALLVKDNGKVYLFDTGAADASFAKAGKLQASLAKANVKPGDVTDIFLSHAHPDHTYGLVAKGALAFPNATIHMSKPEWEFMQNVMPGMDPGTKAIVPVITTKVVAFDPGTDVAPDVKAISTPGHTPGHSSYEIGAGTDKVFYLGDVAHHSVVNVQKPDWSDGFDGDHDAANAVRAATLKNLASSGERVFGVHFPYPGVGRIVQDGDHQAFKADTL
ncbi:MAG TPA: MBL fold metallo-hydrolase [Kofleriaceae bacterium]|jgi:glyoxylase-like metal-dependent hydrolase (beta-lactamase superfamily II)